MSEDKHRRWNWMNATAHWAQEEHNALYDAYEAERQRAEKAEKEVAEHRRHVSIQMSREAKARRAVRAAEQRVRELEAQRATPAVPPGVPSDEALYEIYTDTCKSSTRNDDWPHGRRKDAIAAVRDAILAALPVLTREEVAVTEEEIAEALDDQLSMVIDMDLCKAGAAAVMALLREKQVVQEPEPIATAETLEQLAEIAANEYWKTEEDWKADDWEDELRRDWVGVITAILRAARPEIDLCSASTWRSGESVLHAADVPSLNPYIRYRVGLPPDDFFSRDEMRERQIALYQQWLLAYAHRGWVPKGAHEQALNAALSLPEYMAELNAALDAKGGE